MYKSILVVLVTMLLNVKHSTSQQTITIKKQPSISGYYTGIANNKQLYILFNNNNEVAYFFSNVDANKIFNPKGMLAACLLDSTCEKVHKTKYIIDSSSITFENLYKKKSGMYLIRFEGALSRNNKLIEIRKTETDKLREVFILKKRKK